MQRQSTASALAARLRRALHWLLPPACLLCGARASAGEDFCRGCDESLPRLGPACPHCATPLDTGATGLPCGRCQQEPPAYARVRALFRYHTPVDRLIQGAKYHARLDWGAALSRCWARAWLGEPPAVDALVAVPLHRRRLRERGYNQALELARPLARRLGRPLLYRIERIRATDPQTGLSRDERRRNVRGAFAVKTDVAGLRLAVVDDVLTSGATVESLTRALLDAGALSVEVWVIARA